MGWGDVGEVFWGGGRVCGVNVECVGFVCGGGEGVGLCVCGL